MYILIDNYDSFTYNLYHYLSEIGAAVEVVRNDRISVQQVIARAPQGIILSPGPCTPNEAGICLELITALPPALPLLGVCLGHQAIGQAFGAVVVRAPTVMHGKTSSVHHKASGIFAGLPSPFTATRYHSLIVDRASLPAALSITAQSDDGVIMGLAHTSRPIHGVQFHPESIASQQGHALLANFVRLCEPEQAA